MSKISAVFSDVGGVLLTNGLDHLQRARLAKLFELDAKDFDDRHQMVAAAFDAGQLTLGQYLDRTIFYRPRPFGRQEVMDFMYAQSEAFPESIALIARLARARTVFLATLNNESRELNLHRIEKFKLRDYFAAFFSSCYLGVSKPHPEIYRMALDISQQPAEQCVFVDDRAPNLEAAHSLGMHTIQFSNAGQLESDLHSLGLAF